MQYRENAKAGGGLKPFVCADNQNVRNDIGGEKEEGDEINRGAGVRGGGGRVGGTKGTIIGEEREALARGDDTDA